MRTRFFHPTNTNMRTPIRWRKKIIHFLIPLNRFSREIYLKYICDEINHCYLCCRRRCYIVVVVAFVYRRQTIFFCVIARVAFETKKCETINENFRKSPSASRLPNNIHIRWIFDKPLRVPHEFWGVEWQRRKIEPSLLNRSIVAPSVCGH